MMKCRYETPCSKRCLGTKEIDPCRGYDKCKDFKPNHTTNADRIRSMSDEELAEVIYNGISSDPCDYCKHNNLHCDGSPCKGKSHTEVVVEWLQQPAEECE